MSRRSAQGNGRSALRRRARRGCPMAAYDRLPKELRGWLRDAVLPWSARSALRAWHCALRRAKGDAGRALGIMSAIEQGALRRDTPRIWGRGHPDAPDAHAASRTPQPSAIVRPVRTDSAQASAISRARCPSSAEGSGASPATRASWKASSAAEKLSS